MSCPSTWATPPLGCRKPRSSRIVVDLPAPFGPRNPKISPASTVRSRSASAGASCRPYCFVSPRVSMTAIEGTLPRRSPPAHRDTRQASVAADCAFDITHGGPAVPKHVPNLPGIEAGPYPFSQVVEANGFVFLAGQVGDAPGSHGVVPGGIEAETRAMLENVGRLL